MAPRVCSLPKRRENDGNDAEAICEAVSRPNMRCVPTKSVEQQAVLALHRARHRVVGQRTALANQLRGLLAEYGLVLPQGISHLRQALPGILEDASNNLPGLAREVFADLYEQLLEADQRARGYNRRLAHLARQMEAAQRLLPIPGIGDARGFCNGRQLAAWLGLVPRQYFSGGRLRYGRINKRGDRYLRMLLIHGARAALRCLHRLPEPQRGWVEQLFAGVDATRPRLHCPQKTPGWPGPCWHVGRGLPAQAR